MIDGLRASDDHIEEPGKKDKSDCPSASELISLGKLYRTENPDNESKQAADSADGKKSQHGSARTCEIGGAVCTECCGYRINNKIYDISSLYDKVYFDGTNYRNIENNKIIQGYEKDKSIFELGCIFEIGRIIHNEKQKGKPIDFVEYIKMYN